MFNWRNKNDGFSWEKHVRTTVLYRRQKRRDKFDNARNAAAGGVKKAGEVGKHAGLEGAALAKKASDAAAHQIVKAGKAGKQASIEGAVFAKKGAHIAAEGAIAGAIRCWAVGRTIITNIVRSTWAATRIICQKVWQGTLYATDHIVVLLHYIGQRGAHALRRTLHELEDRGSLQPKFALAAGIVGFVASIVAAFLVGSGGFNQTAIIASVIALPFLALALISVMHHNNLNVRVPIPTLLRTPTAARFFGFAVLSSLVAGLSWAGYQNTSTPSVNLNLTDFTQLFSPAPAKIYKGRAIALSGDTVRLARRKIKLDGIEAPAALQTCKNARSKSWRCGRAAKNLLAQLVRRRTLTCTSVGTTGDGLELAKCATQRAPDIASVLVEKGAVFAEDTLFNDYATLQDKAREKRVGVWSGEALRPAEYRQAKWNAAKKARPDGCPIKGRVLRSGRKYVLPWSPNYRRVRVRNSRGERWFCSEEEAVAAGWKPSEKS
ncbi:MAG: thermonuclease family protein [Hyphomicrobiaceae bacterium]